MNAPNASIDQMVNQARLLLSEGQTVRAQFALEEVLARQPRNIDALQLMGVLYAIEKQFKDAIAVLTKALKISPGNSRTLFNRGNAYSEAGMHQEAVADLERSLAINPRHVDAWIALGNSQTELQQFEKAYASYDKAIRLDPASYKAWFNKGNALLDEKKYEQSLEAYDNAIAAAPEMADAYASRGTALLKLNRVEEALQCNEQAIALQPDHVATLNGQGLALCAMKQLEESTACYDAAIEVDPQCAEAHLNKSLNLLLVGDFEKGWPLYEWRMKQPDRLGSYSAFSKPAWRGDADIRGKRLLIQSEQGLGDAIHFCRYLPQLEAMGAEILFEVPAALATVMDTLACTKTLVQQTPNESEFDAHCPVASLPLSFKTHAASIPAQRAYLSSNAKKVADWQHKLGQKSRPRVGIVWTGSSEHGNDHNRSIALSQIQCLIDVPVEWHSLQKEYRTSDAEVLAQRLDIRQHQQDLKDFSDTAALIECLDLVISVDTSVAHLVGALGKPLWLLLPFVPDFRWLLDRDDSPWYPSARLFRQPQRSDWDSAIAKVKAALTSQLQGASADHAPA